MTVTIAMPAFGAAHTIERAVKSVLAQSHRDLHLVVIGDGEAPAIRARDDRLTVYTLPQNRGTYFCHELILQAVRHRWYAPVDADDWIEPDHIARLMEIARLGETAIATTAIYAHPKAGAKGKVHRGPYMVGMFRKARLTEIGGFNPAERMGQDTLTLRLLRLTGDVAEADVPTYHRIKREGSLTTAPETRLGSRNRNLMRQRNRAVYAKCQRLGSGDAIRAFRRGLVPRPLAVDLNQHVERLAAVA